MDAAEQRMIVVSGTIAFADRAARDGAVAAAVGIAPTGSDAHSMMNDSPTIGVLRVN